MKNNNISTVTRVLLFIGALSLVAVLFTPIWQITLQAPQYPEGLKMFIYADKLAGNIDIINGLNHYIGMKALHANDFMEFKVLPGIIIFFAILFALCSLLAKRKWLNILCILFVGFGIIAMVDFWRWEYDYGHNLNPDAAIIVPGMAYQPPLIGFKQLLNFGAYSIPAVGGWLFVGVGILVIACVVYEWKKNRVRSKQLKPVPVLVTVLLVLTLQGCNTGPQPLRMGQDVCDFCKMTITDTRFGAELVTTKSKVYKFDDAHCIVSFLHADKVKPDEIGGVYFVNYEEPHNLLSVKKAIYFLQSPRLKSPMNGNIAAFASEDGLEKLIPIFSGNKISWEDMQK